MTKLTMRVKIQNERRNSSSAIHALIVELREQLPKNSFVSYTATPQACLLADVNKIVGYPSDFIWLEARRNEIGKNYLLYRAK